MPRSDRLSAMAMKQTKSASATESNEGSACRVQGSIPVRGGCSGIGPRGAGFALDLGAHHQLSHAPLVEFGATQLPGDPAFEERVEPIGKSEHLLEVQGDEQNSRSLLSRGKQPGMNRAHRGDVQAPGGLDDDQQLRCEIHLSREDDFLLVPSGERPDPGLWIGWPDVVFLEQLRSAGAATGEIDQAPPGERGLPISSQRDVLLRGHRADDRLHQAVLGNVGQTTPADLSNRKTVQRLAAKANDAGYWLLQADDRFGKLALAIAVHSSDPHHFAGENPQGDAAQGKNAVSADNAEVFGF